MFDDDVLKVTCVTYHNHLHVEEPEGLLIKLFKNLMCFGCAHLANLLCGYNKIVASGGYKR